MKASQKWQDRGPRISLISLSDVEKRLGCLLPDEYKRFLCSVNGGVPRMNVFPIRGLPRNPTGELRVLLSANSDTDYRNLEDVNSWVGHAIPSNTISIGDTASGDQLILYVAGPRSGEVWFCDWYSRYRNISRRVYFVAKTFKEFVDGLRGLTKEEQAEIDRLMEAAIRAQEEEEKNPRRSRERPVGRRKEKPATKGDVGGKKTHKPK